MPVPGTNEVLVRVIYLSLDPYMRGRMRDQASYAKPVGLGEVMEGGTVGEVVASNNAAFKVGDIVEARGGRVVRVAVVQGQSTTAILERAGRTR
jgi:NADPH-dependent curcumin reductase CurA